MPHYWRPLPVGIGEAAYRMRLTGDPDQLVNVMGLDFATEPTLATANALMASWTSRIGPVTSSLITLEGVHILYQSDSNNQIAVDSNSTAVAGSKGSSTLLAPPNVTYLVRKRTGFAGRKNRGRIYFPGVVEGDIDNVGVVQGSVLTALQAAFTAWYGDLVTHTPVIVHSGLCTVGDTGHAGPHDVTPLPATPILSLEVDDRIATQRRRLNR